MTFWQKIKQTLRSMMDGRNGPDQLSLALLWAGLISAVLGSILGSVQIGLVQLLGMALSMLSTVLYVFCIYRMFSRQLDKRRAENRRYLSFMDKKRTERRQAKVRFQNRKKFKYFKCPGCKAWLRLPHGSGVVTVTCSRCHTSFTQKS